MVILYNIMKDLRNVKIILNDFGEWNSSLNNYMLLFKFYLLLLKTRVWLEKLNVFRILKLI